MIESLNRDCFCIGVDTQALRGEIERQAPGVAGLIAERAPHLFAALPLFVSRAHVEAMAAVVRAVEAVAALPAYREAALSRASEIARLDPGARGVFMGFDFHLGAEGARLIEINTNAGGALLNALLARAQRACCPEVAPLVNGPHAPESLEDVFFAMFMEEWRLAGRDGRPQRVAIVDDAPESQFLYPEFLLFASLFARLGVPAAVVPAETLVFRDGVLRDSGGQAIDLVYNRLTDFSLERHGALREAHVARAAVVTPHPRAHALYADKRNLVLLTDLDQLRAWGVDGKTVEILANGIPPTQRVTPERAQALWAGRRELFFKPAAGYGSRAAYRGDKLTRRVWGEILSGEYVAQRLVPPSERRIALDMELKADVRNYAYAGQVQMLAARFYQGQTTNLRTAGGGFAPVLTNPAPAPL
jgi:hypothetical protein